MFRVNEDLSIYVTRGDQFTLNLSVNADDGLYTFRVGDIVRFKVFGKKECDNVLLQKDVRVAEESTSIAIHVSGDETRFNDVISKPTDYWYEVELNPETAPQTVIGYDEDGAKVFKLFPEGGDY